MAPTPATMTINFVSNYSGPHRVCWRIGTSGPYDCSTIVTCPGGGNPCQAIIPITVDNESCDQVDFNGYVQAACEVEGSLNGRVPFSIIFTPNPTCKGYDVECAAVGIGAYNVINPGAGYPVGSNPPLIIVGGGGTAAAAYGVVGDGGIKTWNLNSGGAGYLGGGSGIITNVPAQNITGIGAGATFDVTVTAGVITAIALSAGATSPGTGYAIGDTFEFNNAFLGGSGAGVIFTVNTVNTGEIQYVSVTNTGSGYSSAPSVTVTPSPVLTAIVEPVMANCPEWNAGNDCAGTPLGFLPGRPLGFTYKLCKDVAPAPPANWTVTPSMCCYNCRTLVFTNSSDQDITIGLSACKVLPPELSSLIVPANGSIESCGVVNSWFWNPINDPHITVAVGAPC